jgi:hypothetical protein
VILLSCFGADFVMLEKLRRQRFDFVVLVLIMLRISVSVNLYSVRNTDHSLLLSKLISCNSPD